MNLPGCVTAVITRHNVSDGVESCFLTGYKVGVWRRIYINVRDQKVKLIKNDKQIRKEEKYIQIFHSLHSIIFENSATHPLSTINIRTDKLTHQSTRPLNHCLPIKLCTEELTHQSTEPLTHSLPINICTDQLTHQSTRPLTLYLSTHAMINSPINPLGHSPTVHPSTYSLTNSPIHLPPQRKLS